MLLYKGSKTVPCIFLPVGMLQRVSIKGWHVIKKGGGELKGRSLTEGVDPGVQLPSSGSYPSGVTLITCGWMGNLTPQDTS